MSQPEKDPWAEDPIDKPPEGFGGWLLLPLLQLIVGPIGVVYVVVKRLMALKDHPAMADFHTMASDPVFLVLTNVAVLAAFAVWLLGLYCLVRFLQKKRHVPRLMTAWYALQIAVNVLVAIQYAADPDLYAQVLNPAVTSFRMGLNVTVIIVMNGILIAYFDLSKRVKNTFVR